MVMRNLFDTLMVFFSLVNLAKMQDFVIKGSTKSSQLQVIHTNSNSSDPGNGFLLYNQKGFFISFNSDWHLTRSVDGINWELIQIYEDPIVFMGVASFGSNVICVTSANGVFATKDTMGKENWTLTSETQNVFVYRALVYANDGFLALGNENDQINLYKSDENCENWKIVKTNLRANMLYYSGYELFVYNGSTRNEILNISWTNDLKTFEFKSTNLTNLLAKF